MKFPKNQVISKDNLDLIKKLQEEHDPKFQITLANLLFSANNPFQSNFSFTHDNTFLEKLLAKFENDYGK